MEIVYNLDFDVAALVLLIIEMVYLRLEYAHDKYSNRLYIMLLHSSLLFTIVDIVTSLILSKYAGSAPFILVRITSTLYFLTNAFVLLVFYRYIVEFLDAKPERTVSYYVRTYFPFIFIIECLIANNFANIFFSGGKYGHFSYGYLIWVIYLYPVYYFLLTLFTLYHNRKQITIKQHISVISFIVISIVSIVIELLYADVMLLAFGYSISLLIMLFSLETPDYRSLIEKTGQLETLREEIDQQDLLNKEMIHNLSYEICAPLAKIYNTNNSVDADSLTASQQESRKYIDSYCKLIFSTINNYSEFFTPSKGNPNIELEEYSMDTIIKDVTQLMTPILKEKSNYLKVVLRNSLPSKLIGYDLLIKQIMINFINDANKYSKAGTITLSIGCRNISHTSLNLVISVEDNGVGMKRDMVKKLMAFNTTGRILKKHIFDDDNFNVKISKKLIEEMNGKLHIDSAVGRGSIFTAIIPQKIK